MFIWLKISLIFSVISSLESKLVDKLIRLDDSPESVDDAGGFGDSSSLEYKRGAFDGGESGVAAFDGDCGGDAGVNSFGAVRCCGDNGVVVEAFCCKFSCSN